MSRKNTSDSSFQNDEEVLGVFGRLKENINEIKSAADSSRNSVDRSVVEIVQATAVDLSLRSRRGSAMSNRPGDEKTHHSHKPRETPIDQGKGERNHDNSGSSSRRPRVEKAAPRSRNESYSSRAGHESVISNSSRATTSRPKHLDLSRSNVMTETDGKENVHVIENGTDDRHGSLKRQESMRSRADSRASEKSYR